MRVGVCVASLLLVALGLAGCTSGADDPLRYPSSTSATAGPATNSTDNSTATPTGGNATPGPAPSANLTATPTNGTAPLNVTFNMTGSTSGGSLAWTLDVDGDNVTEANGATLPASFNFTYATNGTFNATFAVSDGTSATTAHLVVNVTAGNAAAALEEFSCTVDSATAGVVWQGSPAGDLGECAFTTLESSKVLVTADPASGCTINFDEDTSDTFAGGEAAVGETYAEGGEFTMQCEIPASTAGGTGTIGLQDP